jgi:hypothetical protein
MHTFDNEKVLNFFFSVKEVGNGVHVCILNISRMILNYATNRKFLKFHLLCPFMLHENSIQIENEGKDRS